MEDTLRGLVISRNPYSAQGLNPCFNGRYSQRQIKLWQKSYYIVLILVLMEDTLREW